MGFWKRVQKELSKQSAVFGSLIYPPLCLACDERLSALSRLFCDACQQEWPWIQRPPQKEGDIPPRMIDSSATCEPLGAPLALMRAFRSGHFFLAETMASLMVVQWKRLGWPLPDRVVPLLGSKIRLFSKKGKETRLLADEVAQMLLNKRAGSLDSVCARETILFISLYEDPKAFEEKVWCFTGGFHRQILSLSFL